MVLLHKKRDRQAMFEAREEYYKTHINPIPSTPGEQPGSGTFRGVYTFKRNNMPKVYIALGWPEYQDYMAEDWFLKESYYDVDKDVRLIPKERYDKRR